METRRPIDAGDRRHGLYQPFGRRQLARETATATNWNGDLITARFYNRGFLAKQTDQAAKQTFDALDILTDEVAKGKRASLSSRRPSRPSLMSSIWSGLDKLLRRRPSGFRSARRCDPRIAGPRGGLSLPLLPKKPLTQHW